MINLFVEFGFQPLNMEALLDFELIEGSSIINNFEARNITIILTIFRKTKMLENMRIFILDKVLMHLHVCRNACWFHQHSIQDTRKEAPKHDVSNCHFYKLPYIGFYSSYTRNNISSIISKYCKALNVKVIFSPFKLCNIYSPKDFIPDSLKSRVVYKFTCSGCGARYVG